MIDLKSRFILNYNNFLHFYFFGGGGGLICRLTEVLPELTLYYKNYKYIASSPGLY